MRKTSTVLQKEYVWGKKASSITVNDVYSGDRYSGNDGYSGLNPPDDVILFTVSGITAIADNFFGNFDKK